MKKPKLLWIGAVAGLIVGVGLAALPDSVSSQESVVAESGMWSAHRHSSTCIGPPGGQWPTQYDACLAILFKGSALLIGTALCHIC